MVIILNIIFTFFIDFLSSWGLVIISLLLCIVIFNAFIGIFFIRAELDSAKRIIIAEVEKSNQVNLKEIESKIKESFPSKKILFVHIGPIKFSYGENKNKGGNLNDPKSGYLGRVLELVIYREVKIGWLKKPIIISTGVSTTNRSVMIPTKDVEYRVGEEYM